VTCIGFLAASFGMTQRLYQAKKTQALSITWVGEDFLNKISKIEDIKQTKEKHTFKLD
jgi:hypothetical protein